MNLHNKSILKNAVDYLKGLHFEPENIMVTGSIALKLQGLLESRPVHDVDFIIKMDDETWRSLKLLEAIESDDEEKKKLSYCRNKKLVFLKNGETMINIWRHDNFTDWSDIKDADTGVRVASVSHILKVKKQYGRTKDLKDINDIVKEML